MEIDKRSRAELKQYFVTNAIPTEKNFAELIDSMLSQKDDGIAKLAGNPLSIEASGDDTSQKKAIHFYRSFADPDPTWVLSLNPRQNPADPATAKSGLSISDALGNSRLFIDRDNGRVGVGTIAPRGALDVPQGDVYVGKTLNISAPADNYDGGVLNIRNETTKKYWHIDIRANEADKLIFWRNDSSSSPWLAALKIGMDGIVEIPGLFQVGGDVQIRGKLAFRGSDSWLRLNQDGEFTSGVYTPGHLRVDGGMEVRGDNNVNGNLSVSASSIRLGLQGRGGGQLVICNNPNDNKIYLEAFSSDGQSHAAELLLTGRAAQPVPRLTLIGDDINLKGDVHVNGVLNAPAGMTVQGKVAHIDGDGAFYRNTDGQVYLTVDDNLYIRDSGASSWAAHFDTNSGSLNLKGDISFGSTIKTAGRMHITGGEICYILNKAGVVIGKEWGGNGNLSVQGSKNFHIDHPLDPNRFLVHSVIEGPEAAVFYRGEASLVGGECEIELPPYFEALARKDNRTILITPKLSEGEETSALAAGDVMDGKFLVRAIDGRNPKQRFYWEVKGVRADIDPIDVEPMKTEFPAPPQRHDGKP